MMQLHGAISIGLKLMEMVHLQKHYRVKELAALWGLSRNTIIKHFATEEGVLRIAANSGKRKYTVLSIPESVALRVHERLHQVPLPTVRLTRTPRRIIRVKDLRRETKQH